MCLCRSNWSAIAIVYFYNNYITFHTNTLLLTLGAHAPEGYGSCPVCVSVCVCVCVCLSATLIWGLGLVEV